jgi:transposase
MSCHLLMDCAYEGDETRQLAFDLGIIPVVPPHPNRVEPWELKKALYRRRNEIERMFRRASVASSVASISSTWCSSPSSISLLSWKHCVRSVNTP